MKVQRRGLWTFLLFCFVLLCFAIASIPYFRKDPTPAEDGSLELHFLDVGQGDASLIICDGHAMLIDGGDASSSRKVYAALKDLGIQNLDYIISTHPHDDHAGGLAGALNYAEADVAISPVTESDGSGFQSFLKYLKQQGTDITVPKPGDQFPLGSATFTILAPSHISDNQNCNSIVLRLSYGDFSALFTGDAEIEEEQEILQSGRELKANVLKVGHHGGADASGSDFLSAVRPSIAVISCGEGNEYGHPARQTILRLESVNASVLRTDLMGDITIVVQPNGIYMIRTSTDENAKDAAASSQDVTYIVNTGSGKFHDPECSSAQEISPSHRLEFTGTRDELISMGYEPCGRCDP